MFYSTQIKLVKGQIDDLTTEPAISVVVNSNCDGKEGLSVPFHLRISKIEEGAIIWGVNFSNGCLFLVDHVHLFQPLDGGKATRFVNYERQAGIMRYFTNTKTLTRAFQLCNKALKTKCEEEMT